MPHPRARKATDPGLIINFKAWLKARGIDKNRSCCALALPSEFKLPIPQILDHNRPVTICLENAGSQHDGHRRWPAREAMQLGAAHKALLEQPLQNMKHLAHGSGQWRT